MKIYFLKLLYQILFTKIDEEPITIGLSRVHQNYGASAFLFQENMFRMFTELILFLR